MFDVIVFSSFAVFIWAALLSAFFFCQKFLVLKSITIIIEKKEKKIINEQKTIIKLRISWEN